MQRVLIQSLKSSALGLYSSPPLGLRSFSPPLPLHRLDPPPSMPPKYFSPKSPLASSLESVSQHDLRPLMRLFTSRSTSPNTTSSLSPGLIGGLVAIGILVFLCGVGAGVALHIHYCRQNGCRVCCNVARFKRRRSRSVQGWCPQGHSKPLTETLHRGSLVALDRNSSHVQIQRNECLQSPLDRVYLFGSSTQDGSISFPTPFPPLTPPPTVHVRGPQTPEMIVINSAVSVRGSITLSVISHDYAPTLSASEVSHSCPSSGNSPISLVRKVAPFGRTLDDSSNQSMGVSTITLPSFVEPECPNTTPMLATPTHLAMAEGAPPPLTRFSFRPPRSHSIMANTTPTSEIHLRPVSVPDRPPPLHWTRSSSPRRTGIRRELTTLKPAVQAEIVRKAQSGTLGTPERSRTTSLRQDALPLLTVPDYDSPPYCDCCPLSEGWDTCPVPNDAPRPISLKPSPQDGVPLALYTNGLTEPPSVSYHSPVLGILNSQSSHTSLDGKRSRGTSQATSSTSTIPSISAFPSPPGFAPCHRGKVSSILSNYSTSSQPFLLAMLREEASVEGAETTSLNKGQPSTPLPNTDGPRLITTVSSCSVPRRHIHSKFTGRDGMSTGSGSTPGISSMKRLSRVPLGPRQMCG